MAVAKGKREATRLVDGSHTLLQCGLGQLFPRIHWNAERPANQAVNNRYPC